MTVAPLAFPVVANVDARAEPATPSRVKELLVRQVDGPVRWEETVRAHGRRDGVTHTLEIGPGKVLAGLVKRIAKEIKVLTVGTLDGIEAAAKLFAAKLLSSLEAAELGRSTGRRPVVAERWSTSPRFARRAKHAPPCSSSTARWRSSPAARAASAAPSPRRSPSRRARRRQLRARRSGRPTRSPTASSPRGGKAEILGFDVADPKACEDGDRRRSPSALGRLDILVANAGISIDGLLLRLKDEDLERTLSVNVEGRPRLRARGHKVMMRARTGRIIFISSVVGEMGNAGQTAYAASKAALLGLTKTLAREYASRDITVNAVAPGFIDTDMTQALTAEQREDAPQGHPARAHGHGPRDRGRRRRILASDEAAYVTGQVLRVNGGMYM